LKTRKRKSEKKIVTQRSLSGAALNYILLGYPALASRVHLADFLSSRYAILACPFNDNGIPWELEALRFHNAIRRSVQNILIDLLSQPNLG
jgi:hypothetical protein